MTGRTPLSREAAEMITDLIDQELDAYQGAGISTSRRELLARVREEWGAWREDQYPVSPLHALSSVADELYERCARLELSPVPDPRAGRIVIVTVRSRDAETPGIGRGYHGSARVAYRRALEELDRGAQR